MIPTTSPLPSAPLDLAALAAAVPVPADPPWSGRAHAYVAEVRVGDAWCWRVVFGLDAGRRDSTPVGPAFADSADASALARRLNADADHPERAIKRPSVEGAGVTPASGLGIPPAGGPVTAAPGPTRFPGGRCAVCAAQLPESRQARRTCSGRCRVAAWRRRRRTGPARDPDTSGIARLRIATTRTRVPDPQDATNVRARMEGAHDDDR